MKILTKSFFSMICSLMIIFVFSCNIFAQETNEKQQIDFIKEAVEEKFEAKKPVLEIDKKNFGLSESESFSNATLGDGTTYYVISTDYLDDQKGDPFTLCGYVYPIKVGDKDAGIVKVQKVEGELAIVGMSSYIEFEKDLKDAQDMIANDTPTKFIYDARFHISGFAIPRDSGYDFVPTQENMSFGLEKNKTKSFDDNLLQIQQKYKNYLVNKDIVGGMNRNSNDARYVNYCVLGLVLIMVCSGAILFMRKRRRVM